MMIFCDGFDRVARELETSELQLALHDGGRRDVWEGLSGVLEVGDVVLSGLVERHEGAQEFGERSGHGDVVVRGTRRDRGLLHVEARKAENQRSVGQKYALEALPEGTIKGHLIGQKVHCARFRFDNRGWSPPRRAWPSRSGSANWISSTRLSCGGSILPQLNIPIRWGAMSTSRFCPGCTGRAQPPASTGRPSHWRPFHHSSFFSRLYMKAERP